MVDYVNRSINARSGARRALGIITVTLVLTPAFAATAVAGPTAVPLGTAGNFGVLAGSGMTNTGVSTIVGDVGSSPTNSETGFAACPAADCVELTGTNHNVANPNDSVTQQAKSDLTIAYDNAFGRTGGTAISAPLGGGQTLVSGVYTSAADVFVGGDLTLDGGGDPDAVFIFQAKTGTLITAAGSTSGVPNTRVLLTNGAQACNVFWQVGSSATIGTFTRFAGTILANQSVTVNTRATLDTGRVLARNGAVTLDTNTIKKSTCATPTPPPPTTTATTPPPPPPTTTATTPPPPPPPTTTAAEPTPPPDTPVAAPAGGAPTPVTVPAGPAVTEPAGPAVFVGLRPFTSSPAGTAQIAGPDGPVRGPFIVAVTGRAIATVTFWVDGRRIGTVKAKPGRKRFTITVRPRKEDRRVHRVIARVTYTPSSRTRATTHRVTYRRAPGSRAPRFTG